MTLYAKVTAMVLGLSLSAIVSCADDKKIYEVSKAMIIYRISGGGILGKDVNLTIEGEGRLRFREWGAVRLVQRKIEEKTQGALHYRARKELFEKQTHQALFDVDFLNRKIRQHPLAKGDKREDLTKGLHKIGQQMVADVVCDMWEGNGIRRCLYKGIPLFIEYHSLGLLYREEATLVSFDINVSDNTKCALPPFSVEKFALFTDTIKTKSRKIPKDFVSRFRMVMDIMRDKGYDTENLPLRKREELINMIGEPIFLSQKKILPMLLTQMKRTRACLMQADETLEVNRCLKDLITLKSHLTDDTQNSIKEWSKERTEILDRFDTHIMVLQTRMKCIRGAKNFTDLAVCMRGR